MAEGKDPLGKRALFWMPVEGGESTSVNGKHALFSSPTVGSAASVPRASATAEPAPARGLVSVSCSSCHSTSRVGIIEFVRLHFPFSAWLPKRRFDRWMTCPACRHRTWTSVTLSR